MNRYMIAYQCGHYLNCYCPNTYLDTQFPRSVAYVLCTPD